MTITNSTFNKNSANGEQGGAASIHDGTISNSKFNDNHAGYTGGALYCHDLIVTNTEFNSNTHTGERTGGGTIQIENYGSINNCNFTNNQGHTGGAVNLTKGTITNSLFENNTAESDGGAIYIVDEGNLTNCTFINNKASNDGGAIYGGNTFNNIIFIGNDARDGAAINTHKENIVINNSSFINHTSTYGTLSILGGTINNSKFINNEGNEYGVIYSSYDLEIHNCIFNNNSFEEMGGGIYAYGNLSVYDSEFTNNKAGLGGAIAVHGNLYIVESKFENNSANGTTFNIYLIDDANLTTVYKNPTYLIPGFAILNDDIAKSNDNYLYLTKDYIFDELTDDAALNNGVKIQKTDFTLDGQGHTINGADMARIFSILSESKNVTLKNINFINGYSTENGGALYLDTSVSIDNCNFTDFMAEENGGAIYFGNTQNAGTVNNSNFKNTQSGEDGGAIYFRGNGSVSNSNITNASAFENGGAIYFKGSGTVTDSNFDNNKAKQGGSIYFKNTGNITGSSFTNGDAEYVGGAVYAFDDLTVSDSKFIKNTAERGGAIYNCSNLNVKNSVFENNTDENPVKREITSIDYKNMTTTAVDTVSDGRIGKYFTITLKDSKGKAIAGKPVQIGFNGVVYNRVTDSKGQAKLQINLKYAGTYTFAVAYLGDDNYNGSFIVAKIVVNKQKGSLTVPAKSYKASAKTKTLTATFKSAKGNLVKGKKVSFTVNGKTYTATTNAKGVATVKVSLNKKGTYKFTAKFAGDKTYAAISKTAKLTIK